MAEVQTIEYRKRICATILLCVALAALTLAVYWQTTTHEFINFDDPGYITSNPHVQAGVNPDGIRWALTATAEFNWHPLTWLSHMLDCRLFGLDPAGHHLMNILLHTANTILLFLFLTRVTASQWQSAFVAALFALHPLHVESVAWAAERKDVLSALFWMLTMLAYAGYAKRPHPLRYILTLLAFALGLMAKPMLVTLPFVLFLLDYWPLGRWQDADCRADSAHRRGLVLEKIPFLLLAATSSVVTLLVQQRSGAVMSLARLPFSLRLENALVAYMRYIGKVIWPRDLAVLYPISRDLPLWQVAGSALFLVAVTLLLTRLARRSPCCIVGWLWFVGTLVPVIGLVQVGVQGMADRYTYVPLIGLFVMVGWGVPDILRGWRYRNLVMSTVAALLVAVLWLGTWRQLGYWQDSITLYRHTLAITSGNILTHVNLGNALDTRGRVDEAIAQFAAALRIDGHDPMAHFNLGVIFLRQGKAPAAIVHFTEAVDVNPGDMEARANLGGALLNAGRLDEAISQYLAVLRINRNDAVAHFNLGIIYFRQGKAAESIEHFTEALRIKPADVEAHNYLGIVLAEHGQTREAKAHFVTALQIDPGNSHARENKENIDRMSGGTGRSRR